MIDPCTSCGAARTRHGNRGRCASCYRAALAALRVGECARCGRQRLVWPEDRLCGRCAQVVGRRTPLWVRPCRQCRRVVEICAFDLCRSCYEKQPERPYVYAVGLAGRLVEVPDWFDDFVAHVSVRLSPTRARDVLRDLGRHINTLGSSASGKLTADPPARLGRMLVPFLSARGLVFAEESDVVVRARQRQRRRVAEAPVPFRPALAAFEEGLERRRQRGLRLGLRVDGDATTEDRLRTLRNLAAFCALRGVPGWEAIARGDVEAFLARSGPPRPPELGDLRHFFRWARRQHLVLVDPLDGVRIRQLNSFQGATIGLSEQRRLFQRWTSARDVHPHESFFGLAALIHAATTAEIRHLRSGDIDRAARAVRLGRRPDPVPLDPITWTALQRCVEHRAGQRGVNPHLIVTRRSASTERPAGASYFTVLLRPAGVTPQQVRTTRLSNLATRTDPVLLAAAFGIDHKTAAYYRADRVDDSYHDHLAEATPGR